MRWPFQIRRGERATVALLAAQAFLLLATYYVLKTAREPIVLAHGGAELRSYLAGAQALVLVAAVHGYAWLAARVDRFRLIALTAGAFALPLVALHVLDGLGVALGIPLYVWVGLFGVVVTAQLWSLATDVFTMEQGRRLLPIVGTGAALGGAVGSFAAAPLVASVGTRPLLLLALPPLGVAVVLAGAVHRRDTARRAQPQDVAPLGSSGAFKPLLEDRYLLLLAGLALLLSWVNTNGEYVLAQTVLEHARATAGTAGRDAVERSVACFYAGFFGWVNVLCVLLQVLAVGPVLSRFGLRAALLVVPMLALAGYGAMALLPSLLIVKLAKVAENAADYSFQSTARQALYLPTTRDAKYKSRATIDALVVRGGDVLSALVVWAATWLHLHARHLAALNVVLAAGWMGLVLLVARHHARRVAAVGAVQGDRNRDARVPQLVDAE